MAVSSAALRRRPELTTLVAALALLGSVSTASARGDSVPLSIARIWNEQLLAAIRIDIPKPPAHARNLFHLSVAMWDAWAAYDPRAVGYLVHDKLAATDPVAARAQAISHAAYRLLKSRFPVGHVDEDGVPCHPGAATTQAAFDRRMIALGYDPTVTSEDGDSPAALGNRIGAAVIRHGETDGANEGAGRCYPPATAYFPANPPLIVKLPGAGDVLDPNRWQPLALDFFVSQNGIPFGSGVQRFIGVGWGAVKPFTPQLGNPLTRLFLDPGPPPQLGGIGDRGVKDAMVELLRWSSQLDASAGALVDISPGAISNNTLGTDDGTGHAVNPATGAPYGPNVVERADFQRVVTEYWADGPRSETPPGHWNMLANLVADHRAMRGDKRIGGSGPVVDDLEWDVKTYLALNGALHDAAIWAWGVKTYYDSSRPITLIRYMAGRGQSSETSGPSYHPEGLPLVPGLIELITPESVAPAGPHGHLSAHVGEIAVRAWREPPNGDATPGGVGWLRGVEWKPYMPRTFVTPAFPGYTSGHSTFSRAAAEVLAAITGTPFFPGGLARFAASRDEFLRIEEGPSEAIELQWATYFDAADQAGLSRRFGGIHPVYDDHPGRLTGAQLGRNAWRSASERYDYTASTTSSR